MWAFLKLVPWQAWAGLAFAVVLGLAYWHYTALVDEVAELKVAKAGLERSLESQKAVTGAALANSKEWQDAFKEQAKRNEDLAKVQENATAETRRLNKLFASGVLARDIKENPTAAEQRLNSESHRLARLIECATTPNAPRCFMEPVQ